MDSTKLILEAIALRKCLIATYNRTRFRVAPYILYTKHDELHMDGIALDRDGRAPRELKMGTFKLSGLTVEEVSDILFDLSPLFDPKDPKYEGTTLFAVDLGARAGS